MNDILRFNATYMLYLLAVVGCLYMALRCAAHLRSGFVEKKYKDIGLGALGLMATLYAAWFLAGPLIPVSDKTVHREGTKAGFMYACDKSPKCMDCNESGSCVPCSANSDCSNAVKSFYDECFDNYYAQWSQISRNKFIMLLDECIDSKSKHKFFENIIKEQREKQ